MCCPGGRRVYDDAWSTSVSNQLTVFDDNLLALHLAELAVQRYRNRLRQGWLLVQIVLVLVLVLVMLGRVMLVLITKILIVVVQGMMMLMLTVCVVVLVVSSVVLTLVVLLLLLIMATDEVIVLVVRWNRSAGPRRGRSRWWRYQYVVLIFRKVQIVVDVVVVATVVLLQDTVGVLDGRWRFAVVAVEVLILFQLVNQRTPLGVTTAGVVLQYPSGTATAAAATACVIVQLLIV